MLNVCGHNPKFLFVFSQLFFLFSIKTSCFTGLSFPRCHTFHKHGVSHLSSSMLRSWKSLWSLVSLPFPSHTTSSRAYLPTNGLFHKHKKYKSLHVLQNNLVQRESGSQTIHMNMCIFERLANTTHWWKLYMTGKSLGFYVLLSSTISLSILLLYFAGINSFYTFWWWIVSQIDFICGNLSGDFAVPQKVGLFFTWQCQNSGISSCKPQVRAVISSSGVFQCSGKKKISLKEA